MTKYLLHRVEGLGFWIAAGLLVISLSGCPVAGSLQQPASGNAGAASAANHDPGPKISSTADSGLAITVGIPDGNIAQPDGNPVSISTVPVAMSHPSAGYTRLEQDNAGVHYSGNWTEQTSASGYSASTAVESMDAGAIASVAFQGTGIRWIGRRDAWSGIAEVYLDGTHTATVDTYSSDEKSPVVILSITGLAPGGHTLTIVAPGRMDASALGNAVWIDAFDVTESVSPTQQRTEAATASISTNTSYTRVEQNDPAVHYTGSWVTQDSSLLTSYSGGSAAESSVAGAQASLTFTGTAVSWIGYRDTFSGIADVYLDGNKVATVDTYGTLPQSQVTIYSATGLAPVSHTFSISVNGSHNLLSLGSEIWVDAFDVQLPPPDTTPPVVSLTSPANAATVSGKVTVTASASDNVGVAGVQFELDGAALGVEDTSAPYSISWDTTADANGTHTLTAVARDAAGNRSTSAPVTVTVSNSTQPPPDTSPPTVSLTSPANGATVSGSVAVSASASDNVGVAGVQFELDGSALGAEDTSSPYSTSWDTTTVANGTHTLTAVARDTSGNRTTSSPVAITVSNGPPPDTTPPAVSMTAPANGSTASGTITVSASASDNVGVAGVQFELDGSALGTEDATPPYSMSWDTTTVANGSHTLTAVARDAAGNSTTASAVTVTVSNSTQPPPDTTPPSVSMTAPANGATVSGTISVSANASDNVGVAGVQFELDGTALGAEDTTAPYSISWNTATASNGSHTLTAVARDAAGNKSTASPVSVTISNGTGGGTTRIEQDDPAVSYTGTWITASDSSVSGGTATESNEANASAVLTFTGTGVTWISYRGPNTSGIADVSVDGGTPTQVDTYASSAQPQAAVFSVSNLPGGTHTLKIVITGTYDRAGNSAYVVIDAFDVAQ
jgi:hypothetical protein